jgi:hypothetical protein
LVLFGRNRDFVGRNGTLQQLLEKILPGADADDCQGTTIEGLGQTSNPQIALEAAYRVKENTPCSVLWVPSVDDSSFEKAYRKIGDAIGVERLDDDKASLFLFLEKKLAAIR